MGLTFATIQVKNQNSIEPELFKRKLSEYLEEKGLVPTLEEPQLSYKITFSDNSDWVTISSTIYEIGSDSINSDVHGLAKVFNTWCLMTAVFDSDAVFLELANTPCKLNDKVTIGRCEDVSDSEHTIGLGNKKCWEPLLEEGTTWELLSEIWSGEYVFAEEILSLMAPVLGIDSKNIVTDYRYWEEVEPENPHVITMNYKTAQSVFIKEGATKLSFGIAMTNALVLGMGAKNYVSFFNVGGISKGLSIVILGECFKNRQVEIKEMKIKRSKTPKMNINAPMDFEIFTLQLEKYTSSDGRSGFRADVDSYVFFEGVNMEHPSMNDTKKINTALMYESRIYFTPEILSGDKHNFEFFVIPQGNWIEGQIGRTMTVYKTREMETLGQ